MIVNPQPAWIIRGERADIGVQGRIGFGFSIRFPVPGLVVEVDAERAVVVVGPGVDSGCSL